MMEDFYDPYSDVSASGFLFDKLSSCFKQEPFFIEPGRKIFQKKETINGLFLIHRGTIKLLSHENSKKGFTLRLFCRGDILGLFPVLSGNKYYRHTAVSLSPVTLGYISKNRICSLLKSHPRLRVSILQTMARYGSSLEEKASNFYHKSPEEKLAGILLKIASDQNPKDTEQNSLPINTNILADLAGLSRSKTYRLLKNFIKKGYLQFQNQQLQILNFQKLYSLVK